jgi:hypothetical protein
VNPGHQIGVPDAPEQLYAEENEVFDQDSRGYGQKIVFFSLSIKQNKPSNLFDGPLFYV